MANQPDEYVRSVLPIPDRPHTGLITYDAKDPDTSFPPIREIRPPQGAPNVLVVLLDDVGFGASSAFGGPCQTPTFEKLAANGLKYNRFHTTALCAPTRQALLTGRNHHSVGMGTITELATSAPRYNSLRPNTAAPLAEILKLNGYSTAQFGKCHEVPVWQTSPTGPFDAWPTGGGGFEYFFGFIGGETNQYAPALYQGTSPVEQERTAVEGYHFTEDMTDQAIDWVQQQKALMPDKPFFVYFAPGATHAPHHVPAAWSDKYIGRFDQGWDKLRQEIFARQKQLGVIPQEAELAARPAEIPAWDDMPDEMKPVLARQMEVYAGFLEHMDYHIGRLVHTLQELEILENTLILLIVGDNGASAEGTINGTFNETFIFNNAAHLETPEYVAARIDKFGTPEAYNHYAVGWAHAMDTPYQWTKQVASHWGGTRNGTIVHWPEGIQIKGETRNQFHHVIDVAATVLEAAGLPEPTFVHGVQQMRLQGVSMAYSFDEAQAADRHETQYFEMFVNRGIYHKGWTAVTRHSTPWVMAPLPSYDEDVWELYAPDDQVEGVIVAQGGAFGGWSLYVKEGKPAYCYNLLGLQRFKVYGDIPIPAGEHQVRMEFAYDGGGLAKGGNVMLYLDGQKVGEGRIAATHPLIFSADETTDVGSDSATPVSDDYGPKDSRFNGRIRWVQIDLGADAADADHLITPEERLRVAMARQ